MADNSDEEEEEDRRKRFRTRTNPEGLTPFERDVSQAVRSLAQMFQTIEVSVSSLAETHEALARGILEAIDQMVRAATSGCKALFKTPD